MSDQEKTIGTSTSVTLGIMGAVVLTITGSAFGYGVLHEKTDRNSQDIQHQAEQMQEVPSRQEIAQQIAPIQSDLKDIKADIKAILSTKSSK